MGLKICMGFVYLGFSCIQTKPKQNNGLLPIRQNPCKFLSPSPSYMYMAFSVRYIIKNAPHCLIGFSEETHANCAKAATLDQQWSGY